MDRAYITCCSAFCLADDNWNEAYQLALEMGDCTMQLAKARQEEICRVERAFENAVVQSVMHIVTMDPSAPIQIPKELHCYREKNIFFRVLPDGRSGHSFVAALRGVLQSRSTLLTVPLTSFFMYRGTPVLAQALMPLAAEPVKIYGSNAEPSAEVAVEVEFIADALNTPLPDQVVCEVYSGLDGRMYVTNTNITTIALDDTILIGGPLKRPEMLAMCPCVTATCEDTLSVLRNPTVMEALRCLLDIADGQQCRRLSETLHFYGVNLCLLKNVLEAFAKRYSDSTADVQRFTHLVAVEMMARTIKQEFHTEVQAKRLGFDEVRISNCYAQHLHRALHTAQEESFNYLVLRKYNIRYTAREADDFRKTLSAVRRDHRRALVQRLSWLVGARTVPVAEGIRGKSTVEWVPLVSGRITPALCDPELMCSLEPLYRSLHPCEAYHFAYGYPLQIKVAVWQGRPGDALDLASTAATEACARYGKNTLRAVSAQRTCMRSLFSVPSLDNVREACRMISPILRVYESFAGHLTRAKCHIEVGCCLLGVSTVVDVVREAAHHFQAAVQLLPATLRHSHGAWIYLQPRLGLVRCCQRCQGEFPVSLIDIVAESISLSRVIKPTDYCVEYLWELGMELALEHHYAESTRVLTAAYTMVKRTPLSRLDPDRLRDDILSVYSEWDPQRNAAYCRTLYGSTPVA